MTNVPNLIIHDGLVAPGVLRVSTEALNYAREFVEAVTAAHGDGNMAMFVWVDLRNDFLSQIRAGQRRWSRISWM